MPLHEAGTLKYPPKLEEDIWVWLREQYASFILYKAEEVLPTVLNQGRDIDSNKTLLKSIPKYIRKLDEGRQFIFPLHSAPQRGLPPPRFGVKRLSKDQFEDKYTSMYLIWNDTFSSWGRTGYEDVEQVIKEIQAKIESTTENLKKIQPEMDSVLINQEALKRECLKYTTKAQAPKKVKTQFTADLTGWEYLKDFPNWESQISHPLSITVIFSPEPHSGYDGMWTESLSQLKVDAPFHRPLNSKNFRQALLQIRGILQHELRHVAQTLLSELSGAQSSGNPSPSIQVLSPPRGKRPDHALRGEEFYTRLEDDVQSFVYLAKKNAAPSEYREFLRNWVGLSSTVKHQSSDFFRKLKKHQPDKWRKAVTEFTKRVNQELDIPAAKRVAQRYIFQGQREA